MVYLVGWKLELILVAMCRDATAFITTALTTNITFTNTITITRWILCVNKSDKKA